MALPEQFVKTIREHDLFRQTDNLLLAVSGGVDSVVLCELCHRAGYQFSIAHANFQLRGEESTTDEHFVRALADRYKVPAQVKLFETESYASKEKLSIQVAARTLRYTWFNELLKAGYHWLLTAHHAGDNTETMLMNFFRGTGISGLRGILPKNGNTVRPLLPFSKEAIISFAQESHLTWREDSSNSSDKYSRNYFRNTVIPLVNKVYPEAENNLRENARRFREIEELYEQALATHKKNLLEYKGAEVHIPVLKLKKLRPLRTIVFEIVKSYHFSSHQINDVLQLLDGEHGKFVQSATHRIIRNRSWLIIAENQSVDPAFFVIEKGQTDISNGLLKINTIEAGGAAVSTDPLTAHIDNRMVEYPLILRKWKPGDYFYPLGMPKKKKVARFLIDQKLSATQKENVWVLETGKKICWVPGMRIDDRFRVSLKTKTILVLSWKQ